MCSNFFKRVALWSLKHSIWQRPGYALSMDRRRKWDPALNEVMTCNLYERLGHEGSRSTPIHNHFPESKEALLPEPTSLAMRRSASLRSCFPTSFCALRILETQAKRKGRQSDPESY